MPENAAYQLGVSLSRLRKAATVPPALLAMVGEAPEPGSPMITAPVSAGELASTLGSGAAISYGMGRMGMPNIYPGIVGALRTGLGPMGTPFMGVSEAAGLMLSPYADPGYESGRRGYLSSIKRQLKHNVEAMGEAQRAARESYGILSLPVQALHGIFNPITGMSYLAKNLKETLMGKEGSALALVAETAVAASLEAQHAVLK